MILGCGSTFVGWSEMISELVLASFCWGLSSSESQKKKGSRKGHCSHLFRTWTLEKGVGMFRTQLHRGWKMQALPPKRWTLKILNGFDTSLWDMESTSNLQVIRLPVLSGLYLPHALLAFQNCLSANLSTLINSYHPPTSVRCFLIEKGLWMWVCLARAAGPVSEKLKALRVSIDLGWWLWLWIKHPGFLAILSFTGAFLGDSAG